MSSDLALVVLTLSAVAWSTIVDRKRTARGLVEGWRLLRKLLPQFLLLLILVSIFLSLVPHDVLSRVLGRQSAYLGPVVAALFGSIAIIPGPIAYPLAGMLQQSGVSTGVLAVFITTLMMVGVLTFPVEKEFFGLRITMVRNVLSLLGALLIGFLVGGIL